ncbi:MAG: DNA polymerase [Lentimicrobiaceae bacterium]
MYLDIETTGLDPYTCELVTIQIMNEARKSLIIKDPTSLNNIKPQLEKSLIVGQNLKFDSKFLKYRYGITLYNVYDTYLAEIAISGGQLAGRKGASLKDLALKYCNVEMDKTEQCGFKIGVPLTEEQKQYAVNDLKCLPEIMRQQQEKIKLLGLERVIETEMKAVPAVVWLELSGMNINKDKVEEIKKKLEIQRDTAKEYLDKQFAPFDVNINSPAQLKAALNRLEIPVKNTSTEEISKHTGKVIEALKEYKEASKLLSTYANKMSEYINPVSGRIHSNFNQYGAKSGRFTSSKPNLQQQPSKFTEWRSIYTATPGNKIISADYSQIELRIIGQVSHDKEFITAYNNNVDLHTLTASKIYHIPIDKVTKQQRSIAKPVNFGIAYGMWTPGLISGLQKVGITIGTEEAEKTIRGFYKAYPSVSKYLWDISEEGVKALSVRNKAGRLFKFSKPASEFEKGSIKRESKNLPIQSLCADIVKVAMANIFMKLEPKGVKFVNTIHDELVYEVPDALVDEAANIIKDEMEKAGKVYLTDLPCVAEVTIADYWRK